MINEFVELDSVYTKRITDLLTEDPARIDLKVEVYYSRCRHKELC